jgi:hypothetical protein
MGERVRGKTLEGQVGFWCELQPDGSLRQVESPWMAISHRHFADLKAVVEVAREIDSGTPAERLKWSLRHALGELDKRD